MTASVATAAEASALDAAAIARGISSRVLMQHAGAAAAAQLISRFESQLRSGGVAIFAGAGNNGGDAWVVAGILAAAGIDVRMTAVADPATGDAINARARAISGIPTLSRPSLAEPIVVDGLLGTGGSGAPRGDYADAVTQITSMRAAGSHVVSLDIPSCLNATTGEFDGGVVADMTLCFGTVKRGVLLNRSAAGEIVVLDIGIPDDAVTDAALPRLVDHSWAMARIPRIPFDAHKGTRGRLLIAGGKSGMAGAVVLAARGASSCGVGLLRLLVGDDSMVAVQCAVPEATAAPWSVAGTAEADEWLTSANAIVAGPGLGTGNDALVLLQLLLRNCAGALLLDADALNMIARSGEFGQLLERKGRTILTPHPAEMARLMRVTVDEVVARRFEIASELALETGSIVLLKGVPTVIASPDGPVMISASGSPALATGGSGDLLSGVIGTLLAQGCEPFTAAACGAWLHGRAAELAVARRGSVRGSSLDDIRRGLQEVWSLPEPLLQPPVIAELPVIAS